MAASGEDTGSADGETYIEKYTRGVSAVESILALDKLRQEVAIKELLTAQGRPLRKTASVPNISHGFIWGADMSTSSSNLNLFDDSSRSDSVSNLTSALSCENLDKIRRKTNPALSDSATPSKDGSNKPFGLGEFVLRHLFMFDLISHLSLHTADVDTYLKWYSCRDLNTRSQMLSFSYVIGELRCRHKLMVVDSSNYHSYQPFQTGLANIFILAQVK